MIRGILIIVTTAVIAGTSAQAQRSREVVAKVPVKATNLSFGGMLVPVVAGWAILAGKPEGLVQAGGIACLGLGGVVGPSLGHWYAGNHRRALFGMGLRAVFAGLIVKSLLSDSNDLYSDAGVIFGGGLWILVSGMADALTAARSARAYNRKHGLESLSLAPTYDPVKNQVGLRVRLSI